MNRAYLLGTSMWSKHGLWYGNLKEKKWTDDISSCSRLRNCPKSMLWCYPFIGSISIGYTFIFILFCSIKQICDMQRVIVLVWEMAQ